MTKPKWKLTFWRRLKWLLTDYTRADARRDLERQRYFMRMTGLHSTFWHAGKTLSFEEVIALQARKIKGLELQLNQQRKGYLRKVARLERRLAETGGE